VESGFGFCSKGGELENRVLGTGRASSADLLLELPCLLIELLLPRSSFAEKHPFLLVHLPLAVFTNLFFPLALVLLHVVDLSFQILFSLSVTHVVPLEPLAPLCLQVVFLHLLGSSRLADKLSGPPLSITIGGIPEGLPLPLVSPRSDPCGILLRQQVGSMLLRHLLRPLLKL
jgi:hypothetical protein